MEKKDFYAQKALDQIPRILSNLDRNKYSPTYGCFHRDYWLDKTSDFADAVRQFGAHSLALVYANKFPNNIYYMNEKIRDWAIASLLFWAKIQHRDGSFDEFYPNERGWVGPTAFTTFTSIESYSILKNEINDQDKNRILSAIKKASYFIIEGDSEEDHLANHHAMACLALWKAFELFKEEPLLIGYNNAWKVFKTYHDDQEGWSREYDGVDPGYLSATISFLGKIYQTKKDKEILGIVKKAINFSSLFVYPNGFYGGSLGSRNTLHFYSHGFEIFADEIELSGLIADKMLSALGENKLVPPSIISDRYVFYRVPEYLQSFIDYREKKNLNDVKLPYEDKNTNIYYPNSKIFVYKNNNIFHIANLSKGGVLKIFDINKRILLENNCGVFGELNSGEVITSQWVDPSYEVEITEDGWKVSGMLNIVPSNKLFNLFKNIIFRIVLLSFGWSSKFSHFLKGRIRKALILGQRNTNITFNREVKLTSKIIISDKIKIQGNEIVKKLSYGGEFFTRYVPQSRYFQSQELDIKEYELTKSQLSELNHKKYYFNEKIISY